jgi:hypothetical protein
MIDAAMACASNEVVQLKLQITNVDEDGKSLAFRAPKELRDTRASYSENARRAEVDPTLQGKTFTLKLLTAPTDFSTKFGKLFGVDPVGIDAQISVLPCIFATRLSYSKAEEVLATITELGASGELIAE